MNEVWTKSLSPYFLYFNLLTETNTPIAEYPSHGLPHMAGTEPLNEDGSPPHHEARIVELEMEEKMVE